MTGLAVSTANTAPVVANHMPQIDQSVSLPVPLYEGLIETFVTITMMYPWKDAWHQMLLVSHKPLISAMLTYLTGKQILLLPCGYAHVRLDTNLWQEVAAGVGKLIAIGNPEDFTTS
jgi:phosphohistidine phosphatase SixA